MYRSRNSSGHRDLLVYFQELKSLDRLPVLMSRILGLPNKSLKQTRGCRMLQSLRPSIDHSPSFTDCALLNSMLDRIKIERLGSVDNEG